MSAKKLLNKWLRRIKECQPGDGVAIRQVLERASGEVNRWSRRANLMEYVEVACKLAGMALLWERPGSKPWDVQERMLAVWDEIVGTTRAENN